MVFRFSVEHLRSCASERMASRPHVPIVHPQMARGPDWGRESSALRIPQPGDAGRRRWHHMTLLIPTAPTTRVRSTELDSGIG